MRRALWFCLLLFTACADKDSVPAGILPKEKMGAILWDMIQAEQFSTTYLAKDSGKINLKIEDLRLYDQVFRLHGITREDFRKSYRFYQDRPDITRTLFDSLLARGNRLRTESYNKPAPPPVVTPPATPAPAPTVHETRLRLDSAAKAHLHPDSVTKTRLHRDSTAKTRPHRDSTAKKIDTTPKAKAP